MKTKEMVAQSTIDVLAPVNAVWDALTNPAIIQQYMFGSTVESDWKEGGPITWKGEWKGKPYEDKGELLQVKEGQRLRYSHYSPLSGLADSPENYHTVTIDLEDREPRTRIVLTQDGSQSEEDAAHSKKNWDTMLKTLKKVVEGKK